jgi:hypothetical protein
MIPILHLPGEMTPGSWADSACRVLFEKRPRAHHVGLRNSFGNADDQAQSASAASMIASAAKAEARKLRSRSLRWLDPAAHGIKHGQVQMFLPPLPA